MVETIIYVSIGIVAIALVVLLAKVAKNEWNKAVADVTSAEATLKSDIESVDTSVKTDVEKL